MTEDIGEEAEGEGGNTDGRKKLHEYKKILL